MVRRQAREPRETGLVDAYTVAIDPQTEGIAARPDPVAPNYIGSNVSSAWSPDGREVAYVSIRSIARADRFSRTLSIRNLETGEERDLWPALAFFIMPQWSLDGRSILVRGNDLDGRCCLQQVDVASRRVTHIPLADSQATGHYQWQSGHSIVFARNGTIVSHDLFAGTEATIVDIHVLGLDRFPDAQLGRRVQVRGRFVVLAQQAQPRALRVLQLDLEERAAPVGQPSTLRRYAVAIGKRFLTSTVSPGSATRS